MTEKKFWPSEAASQLDGSGRKQPLPFSEDGKTRVPQRSHADTSPQHIPAPTSGARKAAFPFSLFTFLFCAVLKSHDFIFRENFHLMFHRAAREQEQPAFAGFPLHFERRKGIEQSLRPQLRIRAADLKVQMRLR